MRKRKKRTLLKVIVGILVVVLGLFIWFCVRVSWNSHYWDRMIGEVQKHYQITDVSYVNKYNNYFIVMNDSYLVVLDSNYHEVMKEDVSKLSDRDKEWNIVYKLNKLMYESRKLEDKKVTYVYYDVYTLERVNAVELGG